MRAVIAEIDRKKLGMTCVVDEGGRLVGIITDGDLRRRMIDTAMLLDERAGEIMKRNRRSPVTVGPGTLAAETLHVLEQNKITAVVVVDRDEKVLGVVHLHDLWHTGMI
ncbi:Arabinose 5-phosphate isomerase KdsD [compost metagenome]